MTARMLELPPLETAVIYVTRVDRVEVRDRIRTTIEGRRLGYPPETVQVSTLGTVNDWRASLAQRAKEINRPLEISWRDFSHGDRRIMLMQWASEL